MNKAALHLSLLAALLCLTVHAELIDVIDAETGDFSQWRNPDGGGSSNHFIVKDPVCNGKYAFKWTQKDGRSESASAFYPRDKDLWFGWAMYLPKDYSINFTSAKKNQGPSVSQFHGHPCSSAPICMIRIREGHFIIWLKNMESVTGVYDKITPAIKEQWIHHVVHTRFTHKSDGFFKWWVNNKLVFEKSGSNWGSDCSAGPYFKMGTYANTPAGESIYGDEIRVGTSRQEVDPANFCGNGITSAAKSLAPMPLKVKSQSWSRQFNPAKLQGIYLLDKSKVSESAVVYNCQGKPLQIIQRKSRWH